MKRFLLLVFGFCFLTSIFPRAISAQGTYGCKYDWITGCVTDPTKTACDPGFSPSTVCKSFGSNPANSGACLLASKVPCVANAAAVANIDPFCIPGNPDSGVSTAIGCLFAKDPNKLIGQILGWSTIVGAGIAFLLIVFGGFQITTAAGDPKRVKAAQELITAATMGLLLIIFSIFLLNLIGFRILGLQFLGLFSPNP